MEIYAQVLLYNYLHNFFWFKYQIWAFILYQIGAFFETWRYLEVFKTLFLSQKKCASLKNDAGLENFVENNFCRRILSLCFFIKLKFKKRSFFLKYGITYTEVPWNFQGLLSWNFSRKIYYYSIHSFSFQI